MDYQEAMKYIQKTQYLGIKPGLQRIRVLLEHLGDPHKKLKYIHVAGTNGKGSTVAFMSSILAEAGYKVGIFTSPHIQRFSERIRINQAEIPESDIARITGIIKEKIELMLDQGMSNPTEFEIVTAMAFQYFAEQGCDIVVLEAGMGGRLDSTNIIDAPEAAVITTISYDHMEVLGGTLQEIAGEKAGIIKRDCDVVLYPQEPGVERLFEQVCQEQSAGLHKVELSSLSPAGFDKFRPEFDYEEYKSLRISLLGNYQIRNAAVAIKTMEVLKEKDYKIGEEALRNGLLKAKWPGRFEIVNRSPLFLIDGAHNPESVITLADNLKIYFPEKKITFVTGVLADKDYKSMMETVIPRAERFITVTPKSPRALSAGELANFLKSSYGANVSVAGNTENAVRKSLELCSNDGLICAFGSLYFIGGVRGYFELQNKLRNNLPAAKVV